jgi:aerobic-type carbon monoxide dehydrogenase small subunit (CoxS/CutS family)
MTLELHVNGAPVQVEVDETTPLLIVLREHLDLTGCKPGCGEGECGACTVILDGKAVRSCITPAQQAADKQVLTIEGLEHNEQLHPLQQAFLDNEAFQCGYCTPGMIMSALALLNTSPDPGHTEIVDAMQGNICRCGTYLRIVRSIQQAAVTMRSASSPSSQSLHNPHTEKVSS